MKLVHDSLDVPADLQPFFISLVKIRENMRLENSMACPNADRIEAMRQQYNDTLERMTLAVDSPVLKMFNPNLSPR